MIDEEHKQTTFSLALQNAHPLERNPAAVYLASLASDQSRRTMSNALRTIAALLTYQTLSDISKADMLRLNWQDIRYQHSAAIRAMLLDEYSPATVNRMLAALRGVLKEAWRLGYITAEAYQRAIDVRNVPNHVLPAGRELSAGELSALVEICKGDASPAGMRDAAIIGLLYTCGLRRSEVVEIHHHDFHAETGRIVIRKGKGRKQRTVYVTGGALRALKAWIQLTIDADGPIFVAIRKNGALQYGGIVSQTVYDMLKRRGKEAGVQNFSPHDLRRTFVSDMLARGVDIATVADIAGHSNVNTTRRYDRRPDAIKKQAAQHLHFPF